MKCVFSPEYRRIFLRSRRFLLRLERWLLLGTALLFATACATPNHVHANGFSLNDSIEVDMVEQRYDAFFSNSLLSYSRFKDPPEFCLAARKADLSIDCSDYRLFSSIKTIGEIEDAYLIFRHLAASKTSPTESSEQRWLHSCVSSQQKRSQFTCQLASRMLSELDNRGDERLDPPETQFDAD